MFNKPTSEASLLNKNSCLAPTLGVTKFVMSEVWFGSQFVLLLQSDVVAQQSVTKFIAMTVINLVTPKSAGKRELLFNELVFDEFIRCLLPPQLPAFQAKEYFHRYRKRKIDCLKFVMCLLQVLVFLGFFFCCGH